jgi:hypothetical protein
MDPKKAQKLRALVYTGIATGLVGVSTYSAAAHGNASSHSPANGQTISWQADDFVVSEQATKVVDAK